MRGVRWQAHWSRRRWDCRRRLGREDDTDDSLLPRLHRHFEAENVDVAQMFATKWIVTVFTSSFPFEIVTRIWDVFLHQGWKVVLRIMIALLKLGEAQMLQLHFEGIMEHLKVIHHGLDCDRLFKIAFGLQLTSARIDALRAEHRAQVSSQ